MAQIIDLVAYRAAKKREQRTAEELATDARNSAMERWLTSTDRAPALFTDEELVDLRSFLGKD